MTCKNCGANIAAGVGFCGKCGAAVTRSQPSREEIRARVQGGGRYASSASGSAVRRQAAGAGIALPAMDKPKIFVLGAGVLSLLQILYLFLNSVKVTYGYGGSFLSESASMFTALKESDSTILAVLLLLLCLGLLASIVLPRLLRGRQMPIVTIAVSALTLLLFVVSIISINKFFDANNLGVKPHLGIVGWLFILNAVAIPVLIFLAGREDGPAPARAAAPRASAPRQTAARRGPTGAVRPAAARQAPNRRGVNGPARVSSPAQHVTPPDAETIAALRRMAQMHQQGLVSDEEFARIKAECVARGWIRE